jgi:hypothetical protein
VKLIGVRTATYLAGAAIPVLGFVALWQAAGTLGPREAKALGAAAAPVDVRIPELARIDERERQIRGSLAEIAARELGASPIENPEPPAELEVAVIEPVVKASVPEPTIRLTGFFAGREVMATLNGKVRRIGDEIESGWKLVEINRAENSVVVEHKVGGRRTVRR